MGFSKFINDSAKATISNKPLIRGAAKTVVAAPKPVNYPPIASSASTNQLAPSGSIATAAVKNAPKDASLNDTATAFNKPIPPGGAPTRRTFLRR